MRDGTRVALKPTNLTEASDEEVAAAARLVAPEGPAFVVVVGARAVSGAPSWACCLTGARRTRRATGAAPRRVGEQRRRPSPVAVKRTVM